MTIQELWISFIATSFYADLGVQAPSQLRGRAMHDLFDHFIGPFEGYLKVDFQGEVYAQLNFVASTAMYNYKFNEAGPPPEWIVVREDIYQTHKGLAKYGIPMEYPAEQEMVEFYKACLEYWASSPLLEEVASMRR